MEIVAAANARRAAGQSIINLCVGEPTTGASDAVRATSPGDPGDAASATPRRWARQALRRAIAAHYGRWYGADVDPSRMSP